ncbi:solute carrier family 26 protein [Belliella sp. DSM 111904]|uniref:Solute carrier family 26 protein n=1 Tax=Belliella filtrata TaxID=2923435 RepID=A0ABS9V550_9BACT|nr:solute carrier family 26 protein [Belliella filtrata]MCH7411100.1 solute carrier family 26 protein [Belliella filtrata]
MKRAFVDNIKSKVPILAWLPDYKRSDLQGDISAGVTVGIMLIPQGMAYAMLAGLPPIHGLYAATIPLILYAIFGTSRQLAVGPVAMVSLLTAAGIAGLDVNSDEQYLFYAIALAFLVGAIQFSMGLFKLGFIVNFLSHPVINGFTSAAAIIIGLSQVKHLFQIELPSSEHIQDITLSILRNIGDIHWISFLIGALAIVILKFGKKIHRNFPAPLFVVFLGICTVWMLDLTTAGVKVVGDVPSGFPSVIVPNLDLTTIKGLLPIAFTIALVGFAESFAIAKTIQSKHKNYRLKGNQELFALGLANFGAAFFQGYAVTGGFSRTAVNNEAGAKTNLSSLISAALVILTLLFFTGFFYNLPRSILAAVVMVAVSGLIDIKEPLHLWKKDRVDFAMLVATFVVTLTLGIEVGIVSGMVLSLVVIIYRASRPHIAQLGRVPGSNVFRNINRFENLDVKEDLMIVRIDGPIYFANVEFIKEKLDNWILDRPSKVNMIIFNMESVTNIDSTGAHELNEWINNWRKIGTDVCMTSIKGPVRDVLNRWAILECIGADHVFLDDVTAVSVFDQSIDASIIEKYTPYAIQSNLGKD